MSVLPPSSLSEQPGARGARPLCSRNLNHQPWAGHPTPRSMESCVAWEGQKLLRGSQVRSSLPFSPLLGNKQGEGILLLSNSYSCKDNSKLRLQISLFPREERKKKKNWAGGGGSLPGDRERCQLTDSTSGSFCC